MFSLRTFFTQNIGLKIISLILAVALWLFVVGEETAEIGITVPLEIINVPEDLVITNDVIDDLNVRVSGPRSLIRRLSSETRSKIIDLGGVEPGEISFEMLPEDLSLPGGIKVTRLSPSTITLDVERIEKKKLNILPVLQGSPQMGYEVVSVKFTPDAVVVSGPPSALSNMDAIWTKPINVEKKVESFNQAVTLDLPGSQLNLDLKDKESVKVEVIIDQKIVTRSFDEIPVKILNSSGKIQINPEKVKVRLMGPVNSLEKLDKNKDLEVSVDVADLSPGEYKRKLVLKKPKDLTLLEISPTNADVKVFGITQGE